MTKRKLMMSGVFAAALATMAVSGAIAGDPGGYRCDGIEKSQFGGPGKGRHMGMGDHGMRAMMHELDLTDEQRTKIKDIMRDQGAAMQEKMKAARASHEELHDAAFVKTLDAKKVRELANAQSKVMVDVAVARAEMLNKVYNVLTPEQQKKFATLRAERRERSASKS